MKLTHSHLHRLQPITIEIRVTAANTDKFTVLRRSEWCRPTLTHVSVRRPYTANYADIKRLAAEGITSPNHASRILRLVPLAPDVQEAILFGEQPGLALNQLMDGVGLVW